MELFHYLTGRSLKSSYRNLLGRVEIITPVEDRTLRDKCWQILQIMLGNRRQAWDMQPDGSYVQRIPDPNASGPQAIGSHQALIDLTPKRQLSSQERI